MSDKCASCGGEGGEGIHAYPDGDKFTCWACYDDPSRQWKGNADFRRHVRMVMQELQDVRNSKHPRWSWLVKQNTRRACNALEELFEELGCQLDRGKE